MLGRRANVVIGRKAEFGTALCPMEHCKLAAEGLPIVGPARGRGEVFHYQKRLGRLRSVCHRFRYTDGAGGSQSIETLGLGGEHGEKIGTVAFEEHIFTVRKLQPVRAVYVPARNSLSVNDLD